MHPFSPGKVADLVEQVEVLDDFYLQKKLWTAINLAHLSGKFETVEKLAEMDRFVKRLSLDEQHADALPALEILVQLYKTIRSAHLPDSFQTPEGNFEKLSGMLAKYEKSLGKSFLLHIYTILITFLHRSAMLGNMELGEYALEVISKSLKINGEQEQMHPFVFKSLIAKVAQVCFVLKRPGPPWEAYHKYKGKVKVTGELFFSYVEAIIQFFDGKQEYRVAQVMKEIWEHPDELPFSQYKYEARVYFLMCYLKGELGKEGHFFSDPQTCMDSLGIGQLPHEGKDALGGYPKQYRDIKTNIQGLSPRRNMNNVDREAYLNALQVTNGFRRLLGKSTLGKSDQRSMQGLLAIEGYLFQRGWFKGFAREMGWVNE